MTNLSSYQPFLIGQFKTGQFSYLQPWQSPEDAFQPMNNVYTYRGSVNKRQGYQQLGRTGLLRYQNCEIKVADGSGSYMWTTIKHPISPGTITITTGTAGVNEQATDDGLGGFTGTLAGIGGQVNYITGVIQFVASVIIPLNQVITVCYTFTNSQFGQDIDVGNGVQTQFSGTLSNPALVPLSLEITTTTLLGATIITDDGRGNLIGDFVGPASFINYSTGAWNINFTSPVVNATQILAMYVPVAGGSPIMGINHWEDESTGNQKITVEDQKRMAVYNPVTKLFDPVDTFQQVFFTITSGITTTPAITLPFTNISPYSVSITDNGGHTITDIPDPSPATTGTFTGLGSGFLNDAGGSTIDYATGVITITFNAYAAFPINLQITAELQGDYFDGGDNNFFHYDNWKANDGLVAYEYLTNNKDRITLYDGTNLSRPNFPIYNNQLAFPIPAGKIGYGNFNGIATALDIKVYKNRLLIFRPSINTYADTDPGHTTPTGAVIEAQVVRFSSEFYSFATDGTVIPFDFVADIPGHGGITDAPTADWIIGGEYLRDAIVVFFQRSTWLFRYTGPSSSPFNPIFRWDKINNSRTANAPYAIVDYDDNVTAMGTKGLIYCDGVNVERYDNAIVDQYEQIDNDHFIQCQGARNDIANQTWLIYPSVYRPEANRFCDKSFIYNFLEQSFAQYDINLSALGIENISEDTTWASFAPGSGTAVAGLRWFQANMTWNKFILQSLTPEIFGGNQYGYVYILDITETDNGAHIDCSVQSKRWNPFVHTGERCRVGYIDIYYQINPDVTLQIDLFANNSESPNITKFMVLDGPISDDFAWKRLFVNLNGEFVRMNISTPILNPGTGDEDLNNGTFLISGIIVWAMPAGRLTSGVYT